MWNVDDKKVFRKIPGDGVVKVCLNIWDVYIRKIFITLIITHTQVE